MRDCFFCRLAQGEIKNDDIFYEDEKVIAMLDIDWAVKGHTLVVWKEHVLNATDLSEDEFLYFSKIFYRVEKKLLEILPADRSIVLKSGGLEPHFHFHIYPVQADTSWNEIRDMVEKKTRHEPAEGEKAALVQALSV